VNSGEHTATPATGLARANRQMMALGPRDRKAGCGFPSCAMVVANVGELKVDDDEDEISVEREKKGQSSICSFLW
jgi:hypothetical protein